MIIFNDEKIISEQTKEILENFFCFNGVESRKKFQKLIINKEKYNQRLWSEDETIVNHLLSHSQFKFTKTKCDELIKISEDWSSPNINGENAAFFLIKSEMKIIEINEIIQKININIYQKNLNNFYFINYFLKTETFEKIVEDSLKGKNNFPEIRVAKELKKYQEVLFMYPDLFKETYLNELSKINYIKEAISNKEFIEKNQKNAINASMNDEIKKVEQILFYFSLNQKLDLKLKIKSNKI